MPVRASTVVGSSITTHCVDGGSIAHLTANRGGSAVTTNAASSRHEDMRHMQNEKNCLKQSLLAIAYKGAIAGHDQERCKQLLIDHGIAQKKAGNQ